MANLLCVTSINRVANVSAVSAKVCYKCYRVLRDAKANYKAPLSIAVADIFSLVLIFLLCPNMFRHLVDAALNSDRVSRRNGTGLAATTGASLAALSVVALEHPDRTTNMKIATIVKR